MPETPDFESIARGLIVLIDLDGAAEDENPIDDLHRQAIANQLADVAKQIRLLWNARGAADIAKVELLEEAHAEMVVEAIRSLDR